MSGKVCVEFACQGYKTQMEELEENLNDWKNILYQQI